MTFLSFVDQLRASRVGARSFAALLGTRLLWSGARAAMSGVLALGARAPEAAMEQCLSDAYLQAPSAPAARSVGSDVAPPSFTTCSGLGRSGICVTSRGQYTRPLTIRYDANARTRSQIFRQCMLAAGWSEQTRMDGVAPQTIDDDWTRGFDSGIRDGAAAQCTPPPPGVAHSRSWYLGCQSGQAAR